MAEELLDRCIPPATKSRLLASTLPPSLPPREHGSKRARQPINYRLSNGWIINPFAHTLWRSVANATKMPRIERKAYEWIGVMPHVATDCLAARNRLEIAHYSL